LIDLRNPVEIPTIKSVLCESEKEVDDLCRSEISWKKKKERKKKKKKEISSTTALFLFRMILINR